MNSSYRFLFVFALLSRVLILTTPLSARQDPDRLARVRDLVNSDEIVLVWNEGTNPSNQFFHQRIYDAETQNIGGNDTTLLIPKTIQLDSPVFNRRVAVAAGNFRGDGFKHFIGAWQDTGQTITVSVPDIEYATFTWTTTERASLPDVDGTIKVTTGNYFGDPRDEAIVAYAEAETLHLAVFSFDSGSLTLQPGGTLTEPGLGYRVFDIVTGDFDADGFGEIAVLYDKRTGPSSYAVTAKIYSVNALGTIVPRGSAEVTPNPAYSIGSLIISGATGDFNNEPGLEIALAFSYSQSEPGNDTYVYILDVLTDLNSVIVAPGHLSRDLNNESELYPLDIAAGDFDGDARDEFVLGVGSTLYTYRTDDALIPTFSKQRSLSTVGDYQDSDEFLAAGDLDADNSDEIVVVKSFVDIDVGGIQHFEMSVFSIDSATGNFVTKTRLMNEMPVLSGTGRRNYALTLGDFDADRVRLGTPSHYRRNGIFQPVMVVNTPPVHYDIIDTAIIDLSDCYPAQSCGFSSTYIQSSTSDTTLTIELSEDWGADAQVTFSEGVFKQRVKAIYGEKFGNKIGAGTTYTVSTGRIAAGDDWVFAYTYDMDFWEYPVMDSLNPVPVGYFLVAIPGPPRPLWVEGKDDNLLGNQFHPDHETGNVLSYRLTDTYDTVRVVTDFPEQTVGSTGTSFVSLQIQSFRESGVDSTLSEGLEIGGTVDLEGEIFGFDVGVEVVVNGTYARQEIQTQTVRASQSLEVRGDFGHIGTQYGGSGTYYIKPYAYWSQTGALTLDYKVSPLPVGSGSIWQTYYGGKADPAFSLPWRYDTQKGYPLPSNDPSYRQRSRDIVLSKTEPREGDSIRIAARVRNLGLAEIPAPVTVRFYKGDPATGGTLIGDGIIDSAIAPRTSRNAVVTWHIPLGLSLTTERIYAVIDPDDAITGEVHEDNNTGWAPVIALGTPTGVEGGPVETLPRVASLHQSYPNPFNPSAMIRFELPVTDHVTLTVFNVIGQRVATLVDGLMAPGRHEVTFDGGSLPSGVYFYRMQSTSFSDVKKMMLMK